MKWRDLQEAQRKKKIARLLRPGQRCGTCRFMGPLSAPDSFFTGQCLTLGAGGKPCLAPVIESSGTACLYWRAKARP